MKYVTNGMKNVEGVQGIQEAVDAYCDGLFGTLWTAFSEKPWVSEVNWTGIVQAVVKELFPRPVLATIPEEILDVGIVSSAERACEEARFWYGTDLWGTLQTIASGAAQKKLKAGLEAGWKGAWETARTSGEEYLR